MKITQIAAAFALGLGLVSGVNAGLVGVKSIEIKNSFPTWLQVAEVQAFNTTSVNNVAAEINGGLATATSVFEDNVDGPLSAAKANDGSTLGDYPNIFHSGSPGDGETLTITFDSLQELISLDIWGRTDCEGCGDRDVYNIFFLGDASNVLYSASGVNASQVSNFMAHLDLPNTNQQVPEPGSLVLLGLALVGLAAVRRK